MTETKKETKFVTVQDAGQAYETKKRGKEFRARITSFAGKDAVVRAIGTSGNYVVSTFVNLNNSADIINSRLGTDFVEDEKYHSLAANFDFFVETEAEANAIAAKLVKGAKVSSSVVIGTNEYDGKLFLDTRVDGLYIEAPKQFAGSVPLNKRLGDLDDADLI